MAEFPEHPFWDFSLRVYTSDGVGPACLQLQDAHELDVNILLFCAWTGASGRGALGADDMAALVEAVDAWHHDVVRRLRAVRTRMKGGLPPAPPAIAESLRQRIQKTEIDCEHTEQLMLAAAVERIADESRPPALRAQDAADSIAAYFREIRRSPGDSDRESLATLLAAAFPGLAAGDLAAACRRI